MYVGNKSDVDKSLYLKRFQERRYVFLSAHTYTLVDGAWTLETPDSDVILQWSEPTDYEIGLPQGVSTIESSLDFDGTILSTGDAPLADGQYLTYDAGGQSLAWVTPDFQEGTQVYHGVESIGTVTFNDLTQVVSVSSITYWYKGTEYTTANPVTCDLNDYVTPTANTLYYIYFDDDTGELKASDTSWDLTQTVPVRLIFWNGIEGLPYYEHHSHTRNIDWHKNVHLTQGARYWYGLDLTFPTVAYPTQIQVESGKIFDEDLLITIGQQTNARGWYQVDATTYTYVELDTPYISINSPEELAYLDTDTYALTAVGADAYVNYWVYACNEVDRPIYIIPTHASDPWATLAEARAGAPPVISNLNMSPEMKLIYRLVYKGDGTLEDVYDYRRVTSYGTSTVIVGLDDLTDVHLTSPVASEVLGYNGLEWVNVAGASATIAVENVRYLDSTQIIGSGSENTRVVHTLVNSPVTSSEVVETIAVSSNTVMGKTYLSATDIGQTTIDAGTWSVTTYAGVNTAAGTNTLRFNVYRVRAGTGTVTITGGSGTSRTATASSGTPFSTGNIFASSTETLGSYLRTPKGLYLITARTSDTEVTISVPAGYVDETTVAYSVHFLLFGSNTSAIANVAGTGPAYTGIAQYTANSTQGAFTVLTTDRLAISVFATSTVGKTFYYTVNGSARQTSLKTPLEVSHNSLAGLQGGVAGEYYHLTAAQATVVANTSGTNTGNETATTLSTLVNALSEMSVGTVDQLADYLIVYDSSAGVLKKVSIRNSNPEAAALIGLTFGAMS